MIKYQDNPPCLPATASCLADLAGRWWVAHTRSRFEKAFAWDMHHRDIGYFLPLHDKVTVSHGRKRKVKVPLFASYVFICGSDEDRYIALTTNRLCQTIDVLDQEQLVTQLSRIEKTLTSKVPLETLPHIPVGQRCRINAGVLAGIEGILIDKRNRARVALEVTVLGQASLVEVEADLVTILN